MDHKVMVGGWDKISDPADRILGIVRWLRQHAGTIDVDWSSDDGKTFTFKNQGVATLFALRWS